MIDFFMNTLWGWLSITGVVVLIALAVAWFFPPFRSTALIVAGGALTAAAAYAKVWNDATRKKQAEWDKAERKSVDRGNKARSDAVRDVAAGRVRDRWDRNDL